MLTYDELNKQNDNIIELSNALTLLLGDRSMCDAQVTCDLFYDFVGKVQNHMNIVDTQMYSIILTKGDQNAKSTADRFMGGSTEIKRIFATYLRKWCKTKSKSLLIKEHDQFEKDTQEMFEMVLNRIQDETEKLYPIVRQLTGDQQKVA